MTEIDFRWFLNLTDMNSLKYYSGSVFELGEDAGETTWAECRDAVRNIDSGDVVQFLTDIAVHFQSLRDHFAEYGAWNREDIESWSIFELAALCLQEFVHEYRQFYEYCGGSWRRYREEAESGSISGRLYRGGSGERLLYFGI